VSRAEAEVCIENALGLHLRAAAAFAKIAERFSSDVSMERDALRANGKSIISLVTLAAPRGTRVRIVAEGADADAAVQALSDLVQRKFGEAS
jgi:phosphocarrier protein HPr